MAKQLFSKFDQTLFSRSYLVTIGLLLMSISTLILSALEGIDSTSYILLSLIFTMGLLSLCVGFIVSKSKIDTWADAFSKHEISIIVVVLSVPIYLVMYKGRQALIRARNSQHP
ncbi:hypothetical protein [Photobacterium kagoshimensis]|uniref:hypothetical protein n=1 Tax=Photobacterium kagoshimensis TaxID=2910242 RepID=UPI003D1109E8